MYKGPTSFCWSSNHCCCAFPLPWCYAISKIWGLSKALAYPNTSLIRASEIFETSGSILFAMFGSSVSAHVSAQVAMITRKADRSVVVRVWNRTMWKHWKNGAETLRCCSCWCRCANCRKKASCRSIIAEHMLCWQASVCMYACLRWGHWTACTQETSAWHLALAKIGSMQFTSGFVKQAMALCMAAAFCMMQVVEHNIEGSTFFKPDVFKVQDQSCCMLAWPSQLFFHVFSHRLHSVCRTSTISHPNVENSECSCRKERKQEQCLHGKDFLGRNLIQKLFDVYYLWLNFE